MEASAPGFARRIEELVARRDALQPGIERFLNPTEPYAGFSFDLAGRNPPYKVTTDDILALNFLDVPVHAMEYRRLIELRPEMERWLRKLSPDLHLWHMGHQTQASRDANALWEVIVSVKGVGPTKASTLMARKRPKLMPILDRWVAQFYGVTEPFWAPLSEALRDPELRRRVDSLRPPGMDTSHLSLLRILDIAIWTARGRRHPSTEPDTEAEQLTG